MDDSKTSSVTVDNDRESPQKKRKVISTTKKSLVDKLLESLLAPVNRQCADNTTESSLQSPTAVSMTDHCLVHPSWTDSRGFSGSLQEIKLSTVYLLSLSNLDNTLCFDKKEADQWNRDHQRAKI
jgi:hypothetical protein